MNKQKYFFIIVGIVFITTFTVGIFVNVKFLIFSFFSSVFLLMIHNYLLYQNLRKSINKEKSNSDKNSDMKDLTSADNHPIIVSARKRLGK